VFHENEGKFRVRTELEQHIWSTCTRFITSCIIFYNAALLSACYEAAVNAGKHEEAELMKRISPVAWQHINLRGRFEFQKQRQAVTIGELLKFVDQNILWQRVQAIEEILA
jgi:hypothetical protein